MAFQNDPKPARIEPEAARARLLPHLPRRLRTLLDRRMHVPAARLTLADEIVSLVPDAASVAEDWTAAVAAAGSSQWNDWAMSAATAGLVAYLDADAAQHDRPAARALADVVVLLARGADDHAALQDLAFDLEAIATAQVDRTLGPLADDEDFDDPEAADRWRDAHAALGEAWTAALELALLGLRAEAAAAAAAAAILSSGGGDEYTEGLLVAHALVSFGDRVTAPAAERARATARERERALQAMLTRTEARLREARATPPTRPAEADPVRVPDRSDVPEGHVLVVAGVHEAGTDRGKSAMRGYEGVIGTPLPLVPVPDLAAVRTVLTAEYPYAAAAIDRLLGDLIGQRYAVLRPTLLVGPPGCGKSRLVGRLASLLGLDLWRVDATQDIGTMIGGLGRRWSSTEPCHPIMAMTRSHTANPIVMVDEIDKAATRTDHGRLWDGLLPMLERETSGRYPDPAFQTEVDLSHVSWLATANGTSALPAPLLDRLRIIEVPAPGPGALEALLPSLLAGIATSRGIDPRFLPPLDDEEREAVRRAWRGGSVRRLTRLLEGIITAREAIAPRH